MAAASFTCSLEPQTWKLQKFPCGPNVDLPPEAAEKVSHDHSKEMSVLVTEGATSSTQLTGMVKAAGIGLCLHKPHVGSA